MSIVRKATLEDLPRLSRTVMQSFADDPIVRWLFPDDPEYFADGGAVMRPFLRRLLAHDETFTTDDCVSLAAFVPPGRPEVTLPPETDAAPTPPDRLERYAALGQAMYEHTPPEPHWYLNVLGTHPDWQRQGLAALMISSRVASCDEHGLPMYLETGTPANVAYYRHLGFEIRTEFDVATDGPHLWGMIRHPQPR
jgi:GNAT superfamily N-acetyltransferase